MTIRDKYMIHRGGAQKRGIPFLLTFEEWLHIWESSGHLHERGTRKGQYCMSRYGDIGPYSIENVFIQLSSQNVTDAQKNKPNGPHSEEYKKKLSEVCKGIPKSEETKRKMSEAKKNRPKLQCPYCSVKGEIANMSRWHFDNCKKNRR